MCVYTNIICIHTHVTSRLPVRVARWQMTSLLSATTAHSPCSRIDMPSPTSRNNFSSPVAGSAPLSCPLLLVESPLRRKLILTISVLWPSCQTTTFEPKLNGRTNTQFEGTEKDIVSHVQTSSQYSRTSNHLLSASQRLGKPPKSLLCYLSFRVCVLFCWTVMRLAEILHQAI